jgi:hypothetical protein
VRTPKTFVKREAEDLLVGAGMGDSAKGRKHAAISGRVWHSKKVRVVRPVPPEMEVLGRLVVVGREGLVWGSGLYEIMLREDDAGDGRGELFSDEGD